MNINEDYIEEIRQIAVAPNQLALGYPVNRGHAFDINIKLLGWQENSISTAYLNNIASPYYHGAYTTDNIKNVEVQLIQMVAKHFNLKNEFGYVTYGGTEANFASLWWHRKYLQKTCQSKPVIISSARSHYSIAKIANQLDMELIKVKADFAGIDYQQLESIIKSITQPIIYCANFGATVDGAIDDVIKIKELLELYKPNQYKIHGDGAIYGLFIPYMPKYKQLNSIFDYIDTLSFSGHKFLGAIGICGVVLANKEYLCNVFADESTNISYVQDAIDITASGSRQGHYALELYLLLEKALEVCATNGRTNLENLWLKCKASARSFYEALIKILGQDHPLLWWNQEQLSIILPAPTNHENKMALGQKYGLMPVGDTQFGIYVFPRTTEDKLAQFIVDYSRLIR